MLDIFLWVVGGDEGELLSLEFLILSGLAGGEGLGGLVGLPANRTKIRHFHLPHFV